ncbi:glycosyltransferase family 9 protein [Pseudarthrobacter sp. J75]|uniref:glycosyltransferase family 9 protein n=1 Tax=unclassified Pseudarthrobacter TaxID=2647000 RepID=UPI002E81E251|nr:MULTISPECIES: glycosyltransferase family 9 protein [unclassified Pseudarthrobacter]MEE2523530.1 glycosyltransferase family 9 protein [Pseudarthrobacter sp. J47]MEE2530505.1 glycosyltransferase family 9 protein [Pseudarthrobacter sp. J75]
MPGESSGVGPVLKKFDGVSRIAVLRGGGLGDLMFALPAVAALKSAYPGATVTLLGTPLHAALAGEVETPLDEVYVLPFAEGVRPPGPDEAEDPAELDRFFADMQSRQFDLAVQLHGGGRFSNPFLHRLGARHTIGARTPDAAPLDRSLPYVYYQHEVLRALEIVGLAGAAPVGVECRLRPLPRFVDDVQGSPGSGVPVVTIHPGATDPRRRWPVECFGELAAKAIDDGCRVLVVGGAEDAPLATSVVELGRQQVAPERSSMVQSLAGQLGLGQLAALLAGSSVVVANDSGPRHLAQFLGTPTVGVYWAGNVINAGPLGRMRHRIHISWQTRCGVCGADVSQVGWTAPRCPHDETLVGSVAVKDVYADVVELVASTHAHQT